MLMGCITYPPEVQPVRIDLLQLASVLNQTEDGSSDLVIRYKHHTVWECRF